MNERVLPRIDSPFERVPRRARPWRARVALALLARLQHGTLELTLPDGAREHHGTGGSGDAAEPRASLAVHDWSVFADTIARGDIGFAEAYMDGAWDTPDLAGLLALLAANRDAIERAVYGSAIGGIAARVRHWLRANSRAGSRRNIAAHYDLGNDFYARWLDPSMTYSSALFAGDATRSLEAAQQAKYDRILDRLGVRAGDRILEIGCGWGGLAERAAARGAHVHGLSLSREQLRYSGERLARAGLADRATFEYRDYRDLDPARRYDHVVSIEMVEAVGERFWPQYFDALARHLAPGGRAIVQSITIADRLFARYRVGTDFIQQYIFPGGMLPSPARFGAEADRAGLAVTDAFAFGLDYAETLRRWRDRFDDAAEAIGAMGFDERFRRMWTFYLAYCEAAFRAGCTDVYQFELRHR